MASIQERSNKSGISFRVIWRDDGDQKVATFKSRERALRWKQLIESVGGNEAEADRRLAERMSEGPKLLEVYEHWMERHRGTPYTKQNYASYWKNHVGPALADMPVDQIRPDDIRSIVNTLERKDLAPKTIRNVVGVLSPILSHAVKHEWIRSTPWDDELLPANEQKKAERDKFLVREEVELVLAGFSNPDPYRIMLATGLRPSELCALDVSDVNLEAQQPSIRVTKAVKQDRVNGDYIGRPKSRMSVRTIGLPPSAVTTLRELIEGRAPGDPVFTQATGPKAGAERVRLRRKRFYQTWQRRVEKLRKPGVDSDGKPTPPPLTKKPDLYSLRHTHASMMIDAGMQIYPLSRHMGHSSVSVTEKHYAHLMPDAHYKAAQFAATFTDSPAAITS